MGEVERVAAHASRVLHLADAALFSEDSYSSLSLCVIDAVYSISVRYEGTKAVVEHYCQHYEVPKFRPDAAILPEKDAQDSLQALCDRITSLGAERMASEVFHNRQRTSTVKGILKAEAVLRFASALVNHGINYFQDIQWPLPDGLEEAIKAIPGQRSGISLRYFLMLAGSDDLIKPDRMVLRFLGDALQRDVGFDEAQPLLAATSRKLKAEYPRLTPRLLDHAIWQHQRKRKTPQA